MSTPTSASPSFTGLAQTHKASGLLFDNDGTLIDSTSVVVAYWTSMAEEHGLDHRTILETAHGRRTIDTWRQIKPELATWEYAKEQEAKLPRDFGHLATAVPGAKELLKSADEAGVPWAIVTSGTEPLLSGWLRVMNLARPKHVVTGESVQVGKPDPACYRLGAEKLGLSDAPGDSIIVFEDAISGIKAGKAAGYKVVALTTTQTIDELLAAGPDWIVQDMNSVRISNWDTKTGRADVEITNALVIA